MKIQKKILAYVSVNKIQRIKNVTLTVFMDHVA